MSALYLHIPFCLSKCPYCDFYSRIPQMGDIERYVDALCIDLNQSRASYDAGVFSSVFFGGGTPSLLSAVQVGRILEAAQRHYGFSNDVEITLEANPGTLQPEQLKGYRYAGVNRLSLGVQSFDDKQLAWLGRRHDSRQAVQAVEMARNAGFDNLSIDLMFALPNQTLLDLEQQCHYLHQLAPEHLSVYGLTIEDGTPFAVQEADGVWDMPSDEHYRDAFMLLHEQLATLGYEHYEISNYARPGHHCRHNVGYWQRQPYLGVGAGAHSFFTQGWGERWSCQNSIEHYLQAITCEESPRQRLEGFTVGQAMAEFVYLALRCSSGIDEQRFETTFVQSFAEQFTRAISRCSPHLSLSNQRWRFDVEGWLLYNHLIENFM
ncbi:MAG: radical SAM family heme chaperone HemW [Thermodesulfobacteriota bacterium]|nr:radical SAM family heme chaperone HemW [Thermodesulfobacteriota bacterium]